MASALWDSYAAYITAHKPKKEQLEKIETVADAQDLQRRMESTWAREPVAGLGGASPAEYLAGLESAEEWVNLLLEWADWTEGRKLPAKVEEVLAKHADLVAPELVRLMEDRSLWSERSRGKGSIPPFAARILGEMRHAPAVPALLAILEQAPEFTAIGDAVVEALQAIGEPARDGLYQLCERYGNDVESVPYSRAVEVLSHMVRQDRTWTYLRRGLQQAGALRNMYICLAGDYGDRRAVFQLNTLLMEGELDETEEADCVESIALLGGVVANR